MNIQNTLLSEVKIFVPNVYKDDRGFFCESFNQKFIQEKFVQDNHSSSVRGVLRGLHYQLTKPQGKLVRAVSGTILDVAVDIRKSSPTFGKWVAEILSDTNHKQLWIPPGFAHGFLVLSDKADVLYKTTEYWYKEYDRSIIWNDPDLNIDWYSAKFPIISTKDAQAPLLKDADLFE